MSDIDFLANPKKTNDQSPPKQDDKKEEIIWSEPEGAKPSAAPTSAWLSFLNKKKGTGRPALAPKKIDKPRAIYGKPLDKNKIRESRQEILKLIKNNENSAPRKKDRTGEGWLSGLVEKFKKPPSHKQVLIDYQQVFNQEKDKRSLAAKQLNAETLPPSVRSAEKPAIDVKPMKRPVWPGLAESGQPAVAKERPAEEVLLKSVGKIRADLDERTPLVRPATDKPAAAKGFKDSFLKRLFKIIKDKLTAVSRPPSKPAGIGLVEIFQKIKSKFIKSERMKQALLTEMTDRSALQSAAKRAWRTEQVNADLPTTDRRGKPETAPPGKAGPGAGEIKVKAATAKPAEPPESVQVEAPRVIETNLIKGEIITFFDWQRKITILVNAVLIPVFSIAVIYLGLMYYQKQSQAKIEEQNKKYNELTAEIKQAEVGLKEITEFQARLKVVSQIFAKHLYWTNFFNFLEQNTIADVYYDGFSGDTSGDYKLNALTSRFKSISEQIEALKKNQKVIGARTVGGEYVSGDASNKAGVKFVLNLTILNNIFTE